MSEERERLLREITVTLAASTPATGAQWVLGLIEANCERVRESDATTIPSKLQYIKDGIRTLPIRIEITP